ncbi:hypothetical protein TNCV_4401531 [Trichonephila clavipes]|nr:hypothetical protein TNCV_4401531 [Trichonephila clavipes]
MNIKLKNDIPVCQRARRLSCSEKLQPWQWKRRKKRNRFEQTSELYRGKYRCVQPKINLLKRCSYAGETQCFPVEPSDVEEVPSHDGETILLWSPWKYRCGQRTVKAGRCGMQPTKSNAVFARRRIELKQELKLLDIRAERAERERRTREVREQALPSENDRQSYL